MTCGISSSFEFYPGSTDTLNIKLRTKNSEGCTDIFPLQIGDVITIKLPTATGSLTFEEPRIVVDSLVYGQIHLDLLSTDTDVIVSGTIEIKIVRGAMIKLAYIPNGIRRLNVTRCQ